MVPHGVPSLLTPSTRAKRWGGAITAMVTFAIALGLLGSKGLLEHGKSKAESQVPTKATTEPFADSDSGQDLLDTQALPDQAAVQEEEEEEATHAAASSATGGLHDASASSTWSTAIKEATTTGTCRVSSSEALQYAMEGEACRSVLLANGTYTLTQEIVVRGHKTLSGTPGTMPTITAEDAPRAFRVLAGGYLEVRYVTMVPSEANGMFARRKEQDQDEGGGGGNTTQSFMVQGGCVLFEPGATGGLFAGVYFIDDPDPIVGLERAIRYTLEQVRFRVFGGFVYVGGGTVDFVSCLFYDLGLFLPITDYIYIGGQILVVGGATSLTGCTFIETNGFGVEIGIGLNVAVLGGSLVMSFITYHEANLATNLIVVGDAFFVGGGVGIFTGVNFEEWSALVSLNIAGTFTQIGGVQVMTGVSNLEAVGLGDTWGVGAEYAVGAGLHICTGCSVIEYNAIYVQATLGEVTFVGLGDLVSIGTPYIEYTAIIFENGMGGTTYLGAGVATFVGASIINLMGIATGYQSGGLNAVSAGIFIWIGSNSIEASGMEYVKGLGGEVFVGAGSLIYTGSVSLEFYSYLVATHLDFWIMGGCDPIAESGLPAYFDGTYGCEQYELLIPQPNSNRLLLAPEHRPLTPLPFRRLQAPTPTGLQQVGVYIKDVERWANPGMEALAPLNLHTQALQLLGPLITEMQGPQTRRRDRRKSQRKRALASNNSSSQGAELGGGGVVLLHIERPPDGSCDIYLPRNMVEGKGAASCTFHDHNTGGESPLAALSLPSVKAGEPLTYTPNLLLLCSLQLTTRPNVSFSDGLLQAAALQTALAWQEGASGHISNHDTIRVQVYDDGASKLPPSLWEALAGLDLLPPPPPTSGDWETDDFSVTQHKKVVFALTSPATAKALAQALRHEDEEDEGGGLAGHMATTLANLKEGVAVGHLSLTLDKALTVPAYDSKAMTSGGKLRHLGSRTVMLVDPEQPAVPVMHAEYGKRYLLHLEQFPPHTSVGLKLLHTWREGDEAAADLSTVTTDSDGMAQVGFSFERTALKPGHYHLQAVCGPGEEAGHSPSYSLVHGPRPRKLYGPHMSL